MEQTSLGKPLLRPGCSVTADDGRARLRLSPFLTALTLTLFVVALRLAYLEWQFLAVDLPQARDPLDDYHGWAILGSLVHWEAPLGAIFMGLVTSWILKRRINLAIPDGLLPVRGRWAGYFVMGSLLIAALGIALGGPGPCGLGLLLFLWATLLPPVFLVGFLHQRRRRHRRTSSPSSSGPGTDCAGPFGS